jgi:hypothetical protein
MLIQEYDPFDGRFLTEDNKCKLLVKTFLSNRYSFAPPCHTGIDHFQLLSCVRYEEGSEGVWK